jgi:hypothetical protein
MGVSLHTLINQWMGVSLHTLINQWMGVSQHTLINITTNIHYRIINGPEYVSASNIHYTIINGPEYVSASKWGNVDQRPLIIPSSSHHHPPPTSGLRRTCAGSAVDHLRTVRGGTHDETRGAE